MSEQTEIDDAAAADGLPMPPMEYRRLAGPTDQRDYDNPTGRPLYSYVPAAAYERVLDFGCGCGRIARQLALQEPRPERYLGLDVHQGMIDWCNSFLHPHLPNFKFSHHDAYHPVFNPDKSKPRGLRFEVQDGSFTLALAWSVFTHLTQPQIEFYFAEIRRSLTPTGIFLSTWFLFDKRDFPMLQSFQNAMYINPDDPTNAVIYDKRWLAEAATRNQLTIYSAFPPRIRGFQWILLMAPSSEGLRGIQIPEDHAPRGRL
jgi:SAM-dependent methyltransferase